VQTGTPPAGVTGRSPKVTEVRRLYGKYNPEKLAEVAGLVDKYGEDKLLAMVMKKYREQEEAAAAGPEQPDSQGYSPGGQSPKEAQVRRLYGKYNPEKLADVPGLVQKYGEDQLLAMVMKKYREQEAAAAAGPEEPDSPGYFPTSPKVAQVQRLYGKYNPEKLADVPGLVGKYGEDKLLAMVMKKYKEQEEAAAAGAAFTVELTQPGPLGLRFTPVNDQVRGQYGPSESC
jgi:DNA-binding protein Fis